MRTFESGRGGSTEHVAQVCLHVPPTAKFVDLLTMVAEDIVDDST